MKKMVTYLRVVAVSLFLTGSVCAFSGAGSGTPLDPYVITDVNQLQEMNDDLQACYELANDINAADTKTWNGTDGFIPVGDAVNPFTGYLKGNGFTVLSLYISRPSSNVGLFGVIRGASIENVSLANADIRAYNAWPPSYYIGGLAGYNDHGYISNCHCAGNVTGYDTVGVLIGLNSYGSLDDCSTSGIVSGSRSVGGLVGQNSYGFITGCSSTAVAGNGSECGGLVGSCNYGSIRDSSSAGNVLGTGVLGGLAGSCSYMNITNCSATGSVSGGDYVGGLIGLNSGAGKVVGCYSTGRVSGDERVGGLIGSHQDGQIKSCYWTSLAYVSGYAHIGGLVGQSAGTITSSHSSGTVKGIYNAGGLAGSNSGSISASFSEAIVSTNGEGIGGFVGYNNGSVMNSYATGEVAGGDFVGGFAGDNDGGAIVNSYSAGKVRAMDNAGGFAASGTGDCTACFWDIQTSDQPTSVCGAGKTTAQMQTQATFEDSGWDFAGVWDIDEGHTYPFLRPVQLPFPTCGDAQHLYPAGDVNHDCRVNFLDFAAMASHWLECTAPECD